MCVPPVEYQDLNVLLREYWSTEGQTATGGENHGFFARIKLRHGQFLYFDVTHIHEPHYSQPVMTVQYSIQYKYQNTCVQ